VRREFVDIRKLIVNSVSGFSDRLRVVHLSLSPSCVARKKIMRRKWPREILGTGSTRKTDKAAREGLLVKCNNHGNHLSICIIVQYLAVTENYLKL